MKRKRKKALRNFRRVNISMTWPLLAKLDDYAKAVSDTRSGVLADIVRQLKIPRGK